MDRDELKRRLMPKASPKVPPVPSGVHASDCAIYDAPALPAGPCNCGADQKATR